MGLDLYGSIPYVMPIITRIRPIAKVTLPSQSIGTRRRTPRSWSFRYAQTVPKRPKGTETRKTSRQLIGASRPPRIRPMKTPAIPAMLLMPSASPR